MPSAVQAVQIFRELADWHEQRGQPQQRDRFLVLAADAALNAGHADEAERLRQRLLQVNPHHLLKPYASFAEASRASDVLSYLTALRQSHPYEAAERLLASVRPVAGGTAGVPPAEVQVFRVRVDVDESSGQPSRPRQVPPPRDRSVPLAVPLAQPATPASSRPRPPSPTEAWPDRSRVEARPRPLSIRSTRPGESDEPSRSGTGIVPTILFSIVLGSGIALAVYTIARPFLGF